jgi:hypothetical protein
MSALAVLLIAVGIGDVCRRLIRLRWLPTVMALAVIAACVLLGGLWHLGDLPLLVIVATTSVAWLLLCGRAERTGTHQAVPLTVFGVGVTVLILLSGWGSEVGSLIGRWSTWAGLFGDHPVDPDRLLMIVGVLVVQLATGNQLVRLVLGSVGAVRPVGEPQPSDRLKGGRLLGPMERLLILGLGLGGQLTMATAVVAAKSIIRFPEITAQKNGTAGVGIDIGISEVTEYFLVGSFASWILAFGGLALVH